jgi:HAE1 family hydrophobic/amphiphilic exporter-1
VEGIGFDTLVDHQMQLNAIVQKDPNVQAFMSSVGARGGISASNAGILFMRLKPRRERALSAEQFIEKIRPQLMTVPGIPHPIRSNRPPRDVVAADIR